MDTIKINKGNVKMIAHRGVSGLEKENTNAAFVAAGNRSYFGVETDVHKTADGKYVIIHDFDTARVAIDNVSVESSTFDFLRTIQLVDIDGKKGRTDLRIPSLEEYIRICKKYEKYCVLEMKGSYTKEEVQGMIDIINGEQYLDKVIFISFSLQNLIYLRELLPDQPAQFLTAEWSDTLIDTLKQHNLDLDIYYTRLNEENVKQLKEAGILINAWTCDNKEAAEHLVALGVDFITSNILE
ncbi:MAG TPA: glycerophosphodiester phosphodiesterase family protein [Bacillota bacterium]|nr:glycerophosphodiester phosphodiesterase family protein [Bacillota bacterium]HOK69082.1 glycerophosphodiester phosphodiesterase family protein [Bacillota bacterium]HPP84636.1 glycerophosphodiester phosphodiesterase family protein [Bacillota bacterium]